MSARVFDDTQCDLGEGPLWHPERGQLYWFDITAHRLHALNAARKQRWQFDEYVSVAGWLDQRWLMVATETERVDFNVETGVQTQICALAADTPVTRCNEGHADPYGIFWIGTMGKARERGAGAIYRYHCGELHRLYAGISISNAICFTPDGGRAYFADTPEGTIWRVALDGAGWPKGEPELFRDLRAADYRPDGAVADTDGNLWCAQYGHGKVSFFAPDGRDIATHGVPGSRTTCPVFGGPDFTTLYISTARQQIDVPTELDGRTFALEAAARGQKEHRVIL